MGGPFGAMAKAHAPGVWGAMEQGTELRIAIGRVSERAQLAEGPELFGQHVPFLSSASR